ncbi:hypothetical protein TREES_T100001835 [Tupaia chinensis]|uniref:Uncharacterized protein n=1 Tax=Tupaia chinensis TaxID=246437 RepID=L9KJX1_TUPCH|nr:hypothetical protein TREES_T100001835 [Tupaia chinensis]
MKSSFQKGQCSPSAQAAKQLKKGTWSLLTCTDLGKSEGRRAFSDSTVHPIQPAISPAGPLMFEYATQVSQKPAGDQRPHPYPATNNDPAISAILSHMCYRMAKVGFLD